MRIDNQVLKQKAGSTPPVIDIELLVLDLTSCKRCVGTLGNIETAIDTIRPILGVIGAQVHVRKLIIESEEHARRHQFVTSPTIRVNGRDIAFATLESECGDCTDLCGCEEEMTCRVWLYRGEEYTEAPVELVVESLLRELLGGSSKAAGAIAAYQGVPENVQRFLKGKSAKRTAGQSCCPPAEQETCCDSDRRAACCDDSEPEACGCH